MSAPLFVVELTEINWIRSVLRALPVNEFAIFRPTEEGLKITFETSSCSEITVYLPVDLFARYEFAGGDANVKFKINYKRFLDCLQIFGDEGNASLKMTCTRHGAPFCVIIRHSEENIFADVEFMTLNVDDFQEGYLLDQCNDNSIVFNGEMIVEILNDLDLGADDFELSISNDAPNFRIATNSTFGECSVNIPKESTCVAMFNCKEAFTARYNFSNLLHIMKVMSLANKISLSTGATGLLGLNLIIQKDDKCLYIENYFTSQFQDETTE